jgi:hypothetical protein
MDALRRFILWDYARASWQYDVIVAVILAFIFVGPRYIPFNDQPKPAGIAMVHGGYWIEPQQLDGLQESAMRGRAEQLIQNRYKVHTQISVVEPIYDESQQELKGYLAFPKQ